MTDIITDRVKDKIETKKEKYKFITNVDSKYVIPSFIINVSYSFNNVFDSLSFYYCNTSCGIKSIDKIGTLLFNVQDNDICLQIIQESIKAVKESNQKHWSNGCFFYISPVLDRKRNEDFYNYMESKGFICMKNLNPNSGNVIAFIIVEK